MNRAIPALVFDAGATLFDVHSVIATCNQHFPGQGADRRKASRPGAGRDFEGIAVGIPGR